MTDIKITKGKHRAGIVGDSDKGIEWISLNMIEASEGCAHIAVEHVDSLQADMQAAGMEVEIK